MRRSTRRRLLRSAALIVIGAFTTAGYTGAPPEKQSRGDDVEQTSILEVCLPITVSFEGRIVSGLDAENFEVYEDGKPEEIEKSYTY